MLKRALCIILVLAVLVTAFCVSAVSAAELLGDADGDGEVSILDATCVQRTLAGLNDDSDGRVGRLGEVDGDGELSILDATFIQRWLAGMDVEYAIGEPVSHDAEPTQAPTVKPTAAPTEPVVQPTEPDDEVTKVKNDITIYFSNNKGWQKVNAYLFNYDTKAQAAAWPGTPMTLKGENELHEQVYTLTVDVTKYDRVIFNNGSVQTTDLPVSKASSGYFIQEKSEDMKKMLGSLELTGVYPYGATDFGSRETVEMDYPDGYKKKVYIQLPAGYDPADKSKKYPVLYMCDGQNLFGQGRTLSGYEWECDETLRAMMGNGGDGMIIVGIACGDTDVLRNHELTPNIGTLNPLLSYIGESSRSYENGGGKVFSDFVVDEVIPYIEGKYNTNSIRGIAGSSSGGIEAFYIGIENMDKFRFIGALSPAFILYDQSVWNTYLSGKDFSGDVPRIYFYCGNSSADQLEGILYTDSMNMHTWLESKGYPADKMTTVADKDAVHNEAFWALYFPEMLSWCLDI